MSLHRFYKESNIWGTYFDKIKRLIKVKKTLSYVHLINLLITRFLGMYWLSPNFDFMTPNTHGKGGSEQRTKKDHIFEHTNLVRFTYWSHLFDESIVPVLFSPCNHQSNTHKASSFVLAYHAYPFYHSLSLTLLCCSISLRFHRRLHKEEDEIERDCDGNESKLGVCGVLPCWRLVDLLVELDGGGVLLIGSAAVEVDDETSRLFSFGHLK